MKQREEKDDSIMKRQRLQSVRFGYGYVEIRVEMQGRDEGIKRQQHAKHHGCTIA